MTTRIQGYKGLLPVEAIVVEDAAGDPDVLAAHLVAALRALVALQTSRGAVSTNFLALQLSCLGPIYWFQNYDCKWNR